MTFTSMNCSYYTNYTNGANVTNPIMVYNNLTCYTLASITTTTNASNVYHFNNSFVSANVTA